MGLPPSRDFGVYLRYRSSDLIKLHVGVGKERAIGSEIYKIPSVIGPHIKSPPSVELARDDFLAVGQQDSTIALRGQLSGRKNEEKGRPILPCTVDRRWQRSSRGTEARAVPAHLAWKLPRAHDFPLLITTAWNAGGHPRGSAFSHLHSTVPLTETN